MNTKGCILAILLLLTPLASATNGTAVIVNNTTSVSEISARDLAQIYLGKKTLWPSGTRIVPVLIDPENTSAARFLMGTVKKTTSQYRAYWKRRLYSGGGSVPRTFRSSAAVVDYVARTPGAIGVVEDSVKDARVQVVTVTTN